MMLVNVCACFDAMISHGWPAKLPRRCSFFLSVLSFLFSFSFSFLQSFRPCPFFFLQGAILSWKSYNLNRFAKSTRCHPFNSFLQQPGVIICIVVILCATRGSTPFKKKMIMMKKLSRKIFIEAATFTAAKGRNRIEESFQALRKTRLRRIHGIVNSLLSGSFLSNSLLFQHRQR